MCLSDTIIDTKHYVIIVSVYYSSLLKLWAGNTLQTETIRVHYIICIALTIAFLISSLLQISLADIDN